MLTLDKIKDHVYFKFRKAQLEGMNKAGGFRAGKVHVSDVIKPCMRYVYYQKSHVIFSDFVFFYCFFYIH